MKRRAEMGPRDGERGGDKRSLCFSVGIHDPRARVVDRCNISRDISTRAGVATQRARSERENLSCRRHTYRFPRNAVRTRLGASHLPSFVTRASMFASAALARVAASAPTARHGARVSVPSRGASSRRSSHGTRWIVSSRAVRAAAGAPDGDKVCVITGSNTGLGYISALEIAKMPGHKVVMAVRDPAKGADAASRIARDAGADVDVMSCDLASLDSVRAFADAFAEKYDRCDILMNNAGVMALPDRALTLDGIEMQMGTNHAGHFLLTERMMPSILRAPGRPASSTSAPSRTCGATSTSTTSRAKDRSGTPSPAGSPTDARSSPTCISRTSSTADFERRAIPTAREWT